MARTLSGAMAIGDVYAEALLAAANESGQTDEVADQFADFIAYLDRDEEFAAFMTAPSVDDDVRRHCLDRLFRGKLNDLLLNLLHVLNDKGRSDVLRAVHDRFRLRLEEQRGQIEVQVVTATPLPDDLRRTVARELGERLGREAILIERVDRSLIGGMLVQVGDRRVDYSLAGRLDRLRTILVQRASREIFSGREYVMPNEDVPP